MKALLYTTLLLSALLFASCKTNQNQVIQDHYRQVNKFSVIENRLLSDNDLLTSTPSQSREKAYNYSSEQAYIDQVKAKSDEYKVIYDDSEIVNGDIYREAAAHRNKLAQDCNCGSTINKPTPSINTATESTGSAVNAARPTTSPSAPVVSTPTPSNVTSTATPAPVVSQEKAREPDIFAHLLDADKKLIRKVGVSFVNESDRSLLKQYSVIIAALSRAEGVERLKKAFADSRDNLFFVRNEVGLYYAIIGSYESEAEASAKMRKVQLEYNSLYTTKQLRDKFGIPFSDLWILKR